jgi:hypothetical protein
MSDILCPTCGRPNPENQRVCDFCGSPLGDVNQPLGGADQQSDEFDQFAHPLDESSRLDSLFAEEEPPRIPKPDKGKAPAESEADDFNLDDFFTAAGMNQEQGSSPAGEADDELSRLDDFLSPDEPDQESLPHIPDAGDESSRLDDFFAAEEIDRDQGISPPPPADDESSRLDDFFSAEEIDQDQSLSQTPEPEDESSRLEDFFSAEEIDRDQGLAQTPEPEGESQETEDFWQDQSEFRVQRPSDHFHRSDESAPEEAGAFPPAGEEETPFDPFSLDSPSSIPAWDPNILESSTEDDAFAFEDLFTPQETAEGSVTQPAPEYRDPFDGLSSGREEGDDFSPSAEEDPAQPAAEPVPFQFDSQPEESPPAMDFESIFGQEGSSVPKTTPQGEESPQEPWQEPVPDFDDGDSGWLDMLQEPDEREAPGEEAPKPTKKKKKDTDWLERIKRLNKSSELVDDDSSFPDWLTVSEKPADETRDEIPELEEEAEEVDLPDWLQLDKDDESLSEFLRKKDLTNEEYHPQMAQEGEELQARQGEQVQQDGIEGSQPKKFPSWAEIESEPEEIPEELQFLAGMEKPTRSKGVINPFDIEDEDLDDLFDEELPEWLTVASGLEEPPPFEEVIAQAELPGWVEAMRPVVESAEASGVSEDEDYIENYGPLAGIPSVLPAEADIVQDPAKAPRKPLDLTVNKSHQDFVNLLKVLIGDETKVTSIPQPTPIQTQRVLRWIIALILLLSITVAIIFGGNLSSSEAKNPDLSVGFGALYEEIESLYDKQPVLIAFDFQPASSGELYTAAASVVDHLMEQGVYLSFISTDPTGPALAEYFLATTQSEHDYKHTQQYINLGYLPGESAGLLSFLIAPKQIIPLAYDGSNAWQSPPLLEVNSINDFKMILIITDDPDTAKTWLEQVGTNLEDTPLTMVVSAQVEPLIQPYFRSTPQLLSGYVAGLIDSMNYEQLRQQPNLTTRAWLPFNLGIIITVGTVFISGLANGVYSLFSRHRTKALSPQKQTEI